jgi:hypothetical protein
MNELLPASPNPGGEFLFYQTEGGRIRLQVRVQDETVWLSQRLMAELFQKDVRTVNEHIQNIFEERELSPDSVIREFRITAADGKSYETAHYNLDDCGTTATCCETMGSRRAATLNNSRFCCS